MDGQTGLHFVVTLAVKVSLDVARGVRLNAVDRFVDDAETDFGIRCRRTVLVARHDRVRGHVSRLELLLVRNDVQLQHLVDCRNGQQLALVIHVVVFDKRHVEVNVGFVLVINRHVDHDAAAGGIELANGQHLSQFGDHQQVRLICRQHGQHMCGFAGLIGLFVGDKFYGLLVIVPVFKIRPFAFLVGRPERAAAIHNLFPVFIDDCFDVDVAGRGNGEIVTAVSLVVSVYLA